MIRESAHGFGEFFSRRYSPTTFTDPSIRREDLLAILEAASTAPSSFNAQPWRFILGPKESFFDILMEGNLTWCRALETFVLLCSTPHYDGDHRYNKNGELRVNQKHAFDAGTAWGFMTHEAHLRGISLHAMGGFYKDKAIERFSLDSELVPQCVIAFGHAGEADELTERRPLRDSIIERH